MAEAWLNYISGVTSKRRSPASNRESSIHSPCRSWPKPGSASQRRKLNRHLMSLSQANCFPTSSPSAMKVVLNGARFFPVQLRDSTGALPIHLPSLAAKKRSCEKSARFATRSAAKSKGGVSKFAPVLSHLFSGDATRLPVNLDKLKSRLRRTTRHPRAAMMDSFATGQCVISDHNARVTSRRF
jgi:hypothetical protein